MFNHLSADSAAEAHRGAERCLRDYHLQPLYRSSSITDYRVNLYYLDLLEKAFIAGGIQLAQNVAAADIGPSHWFYVHALHAALRWWGVEAGRDVELWGYEVDAFRVYNSLFSRWDHAHSNMRGLDGVHYLAEGFTVQTGRFDLITMLFPFVFQKDHLKWGLPHKLYDPISLLTSVWESVAERGTLILVNQGEEENKAQLDLMRIVNIEVAACFKQSSPYFTYKIPHYVVVARR